MSFKMIAMVPEKVLRNYASLCFRSNIDLYGFSFSEESIYRAAFMNSDPNGALKYDWKAAMVNHHPSKSEYPDLYKDPLFSAGKKKGN